MLGELIRDLRPLRLADVTTHPRSYGFPPGHPPMTTFLGVPITIRGEAYGNLYLAEKVGGGEFSERDEQLVVVLADWASIAIDNARLYKGIELRRDELERAVRGLEATSAIARVGFETDLERVLELIAKRGRAVSQARAFVPAPGRPHAAGVSGCRRDRRRGAGGRGPGELLGGDRADHRRRRAGGRARQPHRARAG